MASFSMLQTKLKGLAGQAQAKMATKASAAPPPFVFGENMPGSDKAAMPGSVIILKRMAAS